jgi:hypothetical protein
MNAVTRTGNGRRADSIAIELAGGDRPLLLEIGHSSRAAPGKANEDFYGFVTPAQEPAAAVRGTAIAIADGELVAGDMFLMASDGVWEVLGETTLRELAASGGETRQIADEPTRRSVRNQAQYMGRNDATAVVAAVLQPVSPAA